MVNNKSRRFPHCLTSNWYFLLEIHNFVDSLRIPWNRRRSLRPSSCGRMIPQSTSSPPKKKEARPTVPDRITGIGGGMGPAHRECTLGAGICPGMGTQIEIPSPRPGPHLQKYVFFSISPQTHGLPETIVLVTFRDIFWGLFFQEIN